MKKLTFLIMCLTFVSGSSIFCSNAYAKSKKMIVDVKDLAIYDCPSTRCDIIGNLDKDTKVKVTNIVENYAQIKHNDGVAYVEKKSLRNSYFFLWYYVIGFFILCGIFGAKSDKNTKQSPAYDPNKCPKCGQGDALRVIKRKEIDRLKSQVIKTLCTRHKNYTTERECMVPATVYVYQVTKQCQYCNAKFTEEERDKVEN